MMWNPDGTLFEIWFGLFRIEIRDIQPDLPVSLGPEGGRKGRVSTSQSGSLACSLPWEGEGRKDLEDSCRWTTRIWARPAISPRSRRFASTVAVTGSFGESVSISGGRSKGASEGITSRGGSLRSNVGSPYPGPFIMIRRRASRTRASTPLNAVLPDQSRLENGPMPPSMAQQWLMGPPSEEEVHVLEGVQHCNVYRVIMPQATGGVRAQPARGGPGP